MLLPILLSTLVNLPVDKAAHFGVSWAINHSTYEVCKNLTESKPGCLVASIVTTAGIGIAKEVMDGDKNSANEHKSDLIADGLGILGSSIVITINW